MNKKLLPAITFGIAVLIFGSIAYASDRRKSGKNTGRRADKTQEEETLRAELLGNHDSQKKSSSESKKPKKVEIIDLEKKDSDLLADVVRKQN